MSLISLKIDNQDIIKNILSMQTQSNTLCEDVDYHQRNANALARRLFLFIIISNFNKYSYSYIWQKFYKVNILCTLHIHILK